MDPTGFFATQVAHRDTHSARPDAPVVPAKPRWPRRLPHTTSARQATATTLRNLAAWIEPRHDAEPCSTAMP